MNIAIRVEHAYGRELRYVEDPAQAEAIRRLTGAKTVTQQHINALLVLGHTFTETSVMGRRVAP